METHENAGFRGGKVGGESPTLEKTIVAFVKNQDIWLEEQLRGAGFGVWVEMAMHGKTPEVQREGARVISESVKIVQKTVWPTEQNNQCEIRVEIKFVKPPPYLVKEFEGEEMKRNIEGIWGVADESIV